MKKYLLAFILTLLFTANCFAQQCLDTQLANLNRVVVGGSVPAGGPSAPTVIQSNSSFDLSCDTSASVSLTGVAAGNLIVVVLGWDSYDCLNDSRTTISISDGTTALTNTTISYAGDGSSGDPALVFSYLLSANAGDKTYTATFGSTMLNKFMAVFEVNAGSGTWSYDTGAFDIEGESTNAETTAITTTGTYEIVFGGAMIWTSVVDFTNPVVGGASADGSIIETTNQSSAAWYKTATLSSQIVEIDTVSSIGWLIAAVAFKAQ